MTTDKFNVKNSKRPSTTFVRRLIEVDLPIKQISKHARREKSIRHAHISTLHVWWARRPLAACRAIICAALWPDPVDESCPQAFRNAVSEVLSEFADKVRTDRQLAELVASHWDRWRRTNVTSLRADDPSSWGDMRYALLDFIADFASWDASTVSSFLETSRALTQAAHESLNGVSGSRPLVIDPFAGGGTIPLEALRVGAEAFASDLNPIPVLLNKVLLEYIPKYGRRLAEEVQNWGQQVQELAEKELLDYFPHSDPDTPPVAYLWARTIRCEGPNCGAEVPLIRSLWLAKKGKDSIALRLIPDEINRKIDIEIANNVSKADEGTIKRGAVTCPVCGYTTPVQRVRTQLKKVSGGADTSMLLAVVHRSSAGKTYRTASKADLKAVERARQSIKREDVLPPVELPLMSGVFNVPIYGINRWDLLFSSRQLLVAEVISEKIDLSFEQMLQQWSDREFAIAVKVLLLLALDKYLDFRSTLAAWISVGEKIGHTFGRQALGMIFDWTEGVPFGDMSGSWERSVAYIVKLLEAEAKSGLATGIVEQSSAQLLPLPNDSVQAFITDPPYYNAVPYADLSDFFYLWLRKGLSDEFPTLFSQPVAPKDEELCEMNSWDPIRYPQKDAKFYEDGMAIALAEARRVCVPSGIGVIVFAHKTTAGWESLLSALISSGWTVTGSWPIDTERSGRLRAMQSAALASSIHLVCRPRGDSEIGDWRDVLQELPGRIHAWLPRLAREGVVGADAIFACLGPALEIFSRYSRVEKASGEQVTLKEYLEYVWAAVSKEALSMVFEGADASGFEEDARLTAMWLWTLRTDVDQTNGNGKEVVASAGYTLEYDAARKIAQGLGAHLENLGHLAEIKGANARLLPVSERMNHLFGKAGVEAASRPARKQSSQLSLFESMGEGEMGVADDGWGDLSTPSLGQTTLDRVHQSMLLFAAGRSEALRRFLVEEGVGQDTRYWSLANALSALYPPNTDEKRWVDGVLARKKGLGF